MTYKTAHVKQEKTEQVYDTGWCGTKVMGKEIGRKIYEDYTDTIIELTAEEIKKIQYRLKSADGNWKNDPATSRQIEYMVALGIHNAPRMNLTKGQASRIIDIAKTDGIGSLGYDEGAVQVREIAEVY